jgi:hypothetical protein
VGLIRIGSEFSHRVLAEAAKGWFLAAGWQMIRPLARRIRSTFM